MFTGSLDAFRIRGFSVCTVSAFYHGNQGVHQFLRQSTAIRVGIRIIGCGLAVVVGRCDDNHRVDIAVGNHLVKQFAEHTVFCLEIGGSRAVMPVNEVHNVVPFLPVIAVGQIDVCRVRPCCAAAFRIVACVVVHTDNAATLFRFLFVSVRDGSRFTDKFHFG